MDENPYRGPNVHGAGGPAQSLVATGLVVLMVLGIVGIVIALLLPAVRFAGPAAYRNQCTNNLKQIAIALQTYADHYGSLPPAYTTDADGKPLHSWRTLILPYLEEQPLYEQIDLAKAWDDPANAEAFKKDVYVFQCPASSQRDNRTTYLAVIAPNGCFGGSRPRKISEITDRHSKTLMVIEADQEHAVPWMKPVDADEPLVLSIGSSSKLAHAGGVGAVFADGSVHFLPDDTPAAARRALITIAGDDEAAVTGMY